MQINNQFIDYADISYELEEKFGKAPDYFTFWENCEELSYLSECKTYDQLVEKVCYIWKNIGDSNSTRDHNMWYMQKSLRILEYINTLHKFTEDEMIIFCDITKQLGKSLDIKDLNIKKLKFIGSMKSELISILNKRM